MSKEKIKSILNGSFWTLLGVIFQRISSFIVLPIIARLLGPESLGTYSLIQQLIQTGDNFSRLGIDVAVHRNGSQLETLGKDKDRIGRLFGVACCLSIGVASILCLCLWCGKEPIAKYFLGDSKISEWLPLSGVIVVLSLAGDIPRWYFAALHAFRYHSIRDIFSTVVGSILTIILVFIFSLPGAIYGLLTTAVIRLLWGAWVINFLFKEKEIRLRIDGFWPETIEILRFGLPFYLSNFLANFITLPILGWLTSLGGIEEVGYLRVAQSIAQLISFIPSTIAPVMISSLSSSFTSDNHEYNKLKSLHLRAIGSFTIIASLLICFIVEFIIPRLFGEIYIEATLLSKITIWNTAIMIVSSTFSQYLISSGQTGMIAIWKVGGLMINLLFCFILIPQYRAMGFLLSQSFGAAFGLSGFAKLGLWGIDEKELVKINQLFLIGLCSLAISFLLPVIFTKNIITLTFVEIFITLGLLAVLFLVSFKVEERMLLKQTLKNRLLKSLKMQKSDE